MTMSEQPLPLNLVATKDLVEEMQSRFDVFVAAGVRMDKRDDLSFQFGVKGNVFDIVAMMEYLKTELIMRTIEDNHADGNGTREFD